MPDQPAHRIVIRSRGGGLAASMSLVLTLATTSCGRDVPVAKPMLLETLELSPGQKRVAASGVELEIVLTGHSKESNGRCLADHALRLKHETKTASVEPLWRHAEGSLGDIVYQLVSPKGAKTHRVRLYRQPKNMGGRVLASTAAIKIVHQQAKRIGCVIEDAKAQGSWSYPGALEPPLAHGCQISVGLHTGETVIHQRPKPP